MPFGSSLLIFERRDIVAWFLNKETGLKWEVIDDEIIKRISNDETYEKVEEKKEDKVEIKSKSIKKGR